MCIFGYEQRSLISLKLVLILSVALAGAGYTTVALAFSFQPTQQEYNSWSRFCQVSYALGIKQSPYIGDITKEEKDNLWRVQKHYGGPWHFCAARIWLQRARVARSEKDRKFALERAAANANFTYLNIIDNPSFKARAAIRYARALKELKQYEQAINVLDTAQGLAPQQAGIYSMMSVIYREVGKDDLALEILSKGNDITEGTSAEINYFLGLLYVDKGDIEKAREHSNIAYKLGYPLPGLRNRIREASPQNKQVD